jgi:hypothetical protein
LASLEASLSADAAVRELIEKSRIADVVNTLFVATDARDWERVRACFEVEVEFDMTSLAGGEPLRLTPDAIADAWQTGLAPIESVQHQTGNLSIAWRETEASATCYGTAYHHRRTRSGRNTRTFVGSYDFRLKLRDGRWRIDLFRFNLKFVEGNLELEKEPAP